MTAPETAPQAWARCRPYIVAALAQGGYTHTPEDVRRLVEAGAAHFWPGRRCAVVTEFWTAPRIKTLNFWLLGGELKELLRLRPGIEAWAAAQGCRRALGGGVHPGWARVLKSAGYAPGWTVFCKDLTP
jgi:hypothetical protein